MNNTTLVNNKNEISINSIFNDKKYDSIFKKGNILETKVIDKKGNNIIFETINNIRFETNTNIINPNIGDKINFEITKSDSTIKLKFLNNLTETKVIRDSNLMSDKNIMELFNKSNFIKDEETFNNKKPLDNYNNDIKTIQAVAKLKHKLEYGSNNVTLATVNMLLSSGISLSNITLDTLTSTIKEVTDDPNIEVNKNNSKYNSLKTENNNIKISIKNYPEIAENLNKNNLPVTQKNIETVLKVLDTFDTIKDINDSNISFILQNEPKEITLNDIYISKHSNLLEENNNEEKLSKEVLDDLKLELPKVLKDQNIENSSKNIDISHFLLKNQIPITNRAINSTIFLKDISQNISKESLILGTINNIKKDINPLDITLFDDNNLNKENLKLTYKEIIKDINNITPKAIYLLENSGSPVTIFNLRNIIKSSEYNQNLNIEELNDKQLLQKHTLSQIQLKLTYESINRLIDKNINIDTMPIVNALNELNKIEEEKLFKLLDSSNIEINNNNLQKVKDIFNAISMFPLSKRNFIPNVINNNESFTIQGIKNSYLLDKKFEDFETFQTLPNSKYGDSFNNIYDELKNILKNLNIEITEKNIKSASILSRSKLDINYNNLLQVKVIDEKLNYLKDMLHPKIAINMIKEGFNLLDMHIDNILEYIDKYNDQYGDNIKNNLYENILQIEKEDISQDERKSMIAIYRMINQIEKNGSASLGINIKSGHSITLGNLLNASKYYDKSHNNNTYNDISINNESLEFEDINKETIRNLLNKTYQSNTKENINRIKTLLNNEENTTTTKINNAIYTDLITKSLGLNLNNNILKNILSQNNNLLNEPIENVLNEIKNLNLEKSSNNINEVQDAFKDLINFFNSDPKNLQWLEDNNIPITINNLNTLNLSKKNPNLFTDLLDNIKDNFEDINNLIPDTSLNIIKNENIEPKNILENISNFLDNLAFENPNLIHDIKTIQDDIRLKNIINNKKASYSIPIKLKNKISNLSMFIPSGYIPTNNNISIVTSINTDFVGNVKSYIELADKDVYVFFDIEEKFLDIIKKNENILKDIFISQDFQIKNIKYNDINTDIPSIPMNNYNNKKTYPQIKKQIINLASSLSNFLNTI